MKKTTIVLSITAAVLAVGAVVCYRTGVFPAAWQKALSLSAAHDEHEGHDEHDEHGAHEKHAEPGEGSGHGKEDGHGHGEAARGNLDPSEIEKATCEHNVRTVDCNECRYELGVVKVAPSVTDALIKTAEARQGDLGRTLRLTGEVQFDQTMLVDVLPAVRGRIVSVKAQLGQQVRKGDVLAVLHSGEFGEAKAAYLEALTLAEVAAQEKQRQAVITESLEKLLAASENERSPGLPGGVLGEWKSKLVGARARFRQAGTVLEREKSLVAKQASSQAELEAAEREMQTAQADYQALMEEIQLTVKLDRLKVENAAKLAEAKLNAVSQRLHLFGLDDGAIKAIPQMKENGTFAHLEVKAPRDGRITVLNVTEGRFVEETQTLYTIADTSNVWVWCDLYERDLGVLHDHMTKGATPAALVKVAAFPGGLDGRVDLVGSSVDESTRTVKVRVQVPNPDGRLRPGMFADVEIPLKEGKKVTYVPRQAVLSDEGQTFAFVHWKDDLWLRRDVRVGESRGELVEIVSGLSAGDRVVASGGFLFKSDILREKMGAGCAD